jgi:hypothetical protein
MNGSNIHSSDWWLVGLVQVLIDDWPSHIFSVLTANRSNCFKWWQIVSSFFAYCFLNLMICSRTPTSASLVGDRPIYSHYRSDDWFTYLLISPMIDHISNMWLKDWTIFLLVSPLIGPHIPISDWPLAHSSADLTEHWSTYPVSAVLIGDWSTYRTSDWWLVHVSARLVDDLSLYPNFSYPCLLTARK